MYIRTAMSVNLLGVFVLIYSTITTSDGTQCLYGNDLPLPTDSNQVVQCGEHQSCFLEAIVTINGVMRYKAGCRDKRICVNTFFLDDELPYEVNANVYNKRDGETIVCSHCCDEKLCNSHGCGHTGYQTQRGPVCMSCNDQLEPTECYKITECGLGEVCMLNTYNHPTAHQKRYQTKCEQAERCHIDVQQHLQIKNTMVGRKRETNTVFTEKDVACHISCCSDDLCNGNCTALTQEQVSTDVSSTLSTSVHSSPTTVPTTSLTLTSTTPASTTSTTQSAPSTKSPHTTPSTTTALPVTYHCLSNPCHRGDCLEYHDTFYCKCPEGYIGRYCEENIFAQAAKTVTMPPASTTTTTQSTTTSTPKPTTTTTTPKPTTTTPKPTTTTTTPMPTTTTTTPKPTTTTPKPTTTTPKPTTTTTTPKPTTTTTTPKSTPMSTTTKTTSTLPTTQYNQCLNSSCVHGTCASWASFSCICDFGYTGESCNIELATPRPTTQLTTQNGPSNFCQEEPCVWGSCYTIANGFVCDCHAGYTGLLCDTVINGNISTTPESIVPDTNPPQVHREHHHYNQTIIDCSTNPCMNGKCYPAVPDTFVCICFEGFHGRHCDMKTSANLTTELGSSTRNNATSSTSTASSSSSSAYGGASSSASASASSSSSSSTSSGSSSSASASTSQSTCKGAENVTFFSVGGNPSYLISPQRHDHVSHSEAIQKCTAYCSRLLHIDSTDKLHAVQAFMRHDMLSYFQRTFWIDGQWENNTWKSSYNNKRGRRTLILLQTLLNLVHGKCASLKFGGIEATLESNFCHVNDGFICERI